MLIGLNEIVEFCMAFLDDNIDLDYGSVAVSTDFYCYPNTKEIFVSVLAPETALDDFATNLGTRTDIEDISLFTWSFLHEVGHCMTWNYLNKRTKNHCQHVERKIQRGSVSPLVYYDLATEKVATDWAIGFVENNHRLVKAFDKNVLDLLTKFYLENEVE